MVTLLFILACLLTILCYRKKRQLERKGGKPFIYHFVNQSIDFLVPFCIVTFIFLAISLFVSGETDSATVHGLIRMENTLQFIKDKISFIKLGPIGSVVILSALFIVNLLGIPSVYTEHVFPIFKKYNKVIKKVYALLVILCSFTFFGDQLGRPIANLRFRINARSDEARKGYADLQEQVRSAISKEVAGQLYDETYKAFTRTYQDGLSKREELVHDLAVLNASYKDGSYRRYDPGDVRAVSTLLKDEPPPRPKGGGPASGGSDNNTPPDAPPGQGSGNFGPSDEGNLDSEPVIKDFFDPLPAQPPSSEKVPPPELDPQDVKEASEKVKTFEGKYQTEAIRFFKSEAGKDLLVQPPKIITSSIRKQIFDGLVHRYPILEPIVSVFVGSFDKEMETKVQEATDRVTDKILQNPGQAGSIIKDEVAAIVKTKVSRIPDSITDRAKKLGDRVMEKLKEITSLRDKLAERKEAREREMRERQEEVARRQDSTLNDLYNLLHPSRSEASTYIDLLTCNIQQNRLYAVKWLSQHGGELSKEEVSTVKGLLNNNDSRYIILSGNYGRFIPGVTQYEVAPVKYYAGLALSSMDSSYVSGSDKALARNIVSNAEREIAASRTYASPEIYNRGTT